MILRRFDEWLGTFWVSNRPLSPLGAKTSIATTPTARKIAILLWIIAPYVVFYKTCVVSFRFRTTDDFFQLHQAMQRFVDRIPVYSEDYTATNPHYLYNPGATLLLSPFGYIDNYDLARNMFVCINAASIIISLGLLTKLFSFSLKHFIWPMSVVILLLTEGATHTLQFANMNGVILLGISVFLWAFIRGHSVLAGLAIGCAALFKPMLLPLILLALIARKWVIALVMALTPILFNLIAWPIVPQPGDYITKLVPYLQITRNYFNCSIPGVRVIYDLPTTVYYLWWLLVAVAAGVALVILSRWRFTDKLLWLVSSTAIIVVTVPTLSNLGQAYYSIFAFPLVFTVFHYRSLMHSPVIMLSMVGFYSYFNYSITDFTFLGYYELLQYTFSWSLLVVGSAIITVSWWRTEQETSGKVHDGRLRPPVEGTVAQSAI